MKKWRVFCVAAAVLVLLAAPVLGLNFTMRRGYPTLNVSVEDLVLEASCFSMTATQGGNSGTTFRQASWEIEDGTLYVTLFSGLVCSGFYQDKLHVEIEDDALGEVQQVCLRDGSATKLIYLK